MGYEQQRDMSQSRGVLMFAKSPAALDDALALRSLTTEPYFRNSFFDAHPKTSPGEFVDYAKAIASTWKEDNKFTGIGKPYFEALLAGYVDYLRESKITPDNRFVRAYRAAIQEGRIDSSLAYLLDDETQLTGRTAKKFGDIDNAVAGKWHLVPPVIVYAGDGTLSFKESSGKICRAENLDGHHRFFIAQLLGRPTIDALVTDPVPKQRKSVGRISA